MRHTVKHELQAALASFPVPVACVLCTVDDATHRIVVIARSALEDGTPIVRTHTPHGRAVCARCLYGFLTGVRATEGTVKP